MVTLYVLESLSNKKRYVGITNNLSRRIKEHQLSKTKAGQLLKNFLILHIENFIDHNAARAHEKFLKSGQGREWLAQTYPRACAPKAHSIPAKAAGLPTKTAGLPAKGG